MNILRTLARFENFEWTFYNLSWNKDCSWLWENLTRTLAKVLRTSKYTHSNAPIHPPWKETLSLCSERIDCWATEHSSHADTLKLKANKMLGNCRGSEREITAWAWRRPQGTGEMDIDWLSHSEPIKAIVATYYIGPSVHPWPDGSVRSLPGCLSCLALQAEEKTDGSFISLSASFFPSTLFLWFINNGQE